jgi:hypothetical protein
LLAMTWLGRFEDWQSWLQAAVMAAVMPVAYRVAARMRRRPADAAVASVAITGVRALATAVGRPGALGV